MNMNSGLKQLTQTADLREIERLLAQMRRLYATLSQVNQTIVRTKNADELFSSVCDVAVGFGGFILAWVGLLDETTGAVRPCASKGLDITHWPFDEVNILRGTFKDGLSARAIRSSAVVTSDDVQRDHRFGELHDQIFRFPYRSSASIPFSVKGKNRGVLNLVSDEAGLFNSEEEVRLLEEIGADISYALETIENEAERLRAEERSEQSRRMLSLFVDYAPAAIAMFDRDMRYLAVSRRFLSDYRLGDTDVIGRSHYDIFPDVPERWREIHKRCLAGAIEKAERDPFPRNDGGIEWVRWEIHPWYDRPGKIGGIVLFSEVITDFVRAEETLRINQQRLKEAQRVGGLGFFDRNLMTNELVLSDEALELYGFNAGDQPALSDVFTRQHPDDRERIRQSIDEVIASGSRNVLEYRIMRPDGTERYVQTTVEVFRDAQGRADRLLGTIYDMTERKLAAEALLESASKLETALASMTDAVFISDVDGRFVEFNDAFATFHKFQTREECSRTFAENPSFLEVFFPNGERAPVDMWAVPRALRGETVRNAEYTLRRKDTGQTWVGSYSFSPIHDHRGTIIGSVVAGRDITDMKVLQAQLMQAQKLESLGTLASGIAHDFNNILSIIIGHASLMQEEPVDIATLPKRVRAIMKAGTRGADLVKQLLTFARKTDVQIHSLILNDVVDEILRLIHETFPKSVEVGAELDHDLPAIAADATHVHQVLLNLCVNARDAMPKGGRLTIRTHRAWGDSVRATHPNAGAAQYAVLSVNDSGSGMDEETQRRIFEPFFTTKERGKGTGLGLSMVFGIMESHRGFIELQSEIGKGSTFSCFFPVPDGDR